MIMIELHLFFMPKDLEQKRALLANPDAAGKLAELVDFWWCLLFVVKKYSNLRGGGGNVFRKAIKFLVPARMIQWLSWMFVLGKLVELFFIWVYFFGNSFFQGSSRIDLRIEKQSFKRYVMNKIFKKWWTIICAKMFKIVLKHIPATY